MADELCRLPNQISKKGSQIAITLEDFTAADYKHVDIKAFHNKSVATTVKPTEADQDDDTTGLAEPATAVVSEEMEVENLSEVTETDESPQKLPGEVFSVRVQCRKMGQEPHFVRLYERSGGEKPWQLLETTTLEAGPDPGWGKFLQVPQRQTQTELLFAVYSESAGGEGEELQGNVVVPLADLVLQGDEDVSFDLQFPDADAGARIAMPNVLDGVSTKPSAMRRGSVSDLFHPPELNQNKLRKRSISKSIQKGVAKRFFLRAEKKRKGDVSGLEGNMDTGLGPRLLLHLFSRDPYLPRPVVIHVRCKRLMALKEGQGLLPALTVQQEMQGAWTFAAKRQWRDVSSVDRCITFRLDLTPYSSQRLKFSLFLKVRFHANLTF
jgi:hypothetical protein